VLAGGIAEYEADSIQIRTDPILAHSMAENNDANMVNHDVKLPITDNDRSKSAVWLWNIAPIPDEVGA
jgi:hypothetical protein